MKIINPRLARYNTTVNVAADGDPDMRSPGDEITAAQAKRLKDRHFGGFPVVVTAAKVEPEKSDEDSPT